MTTGEERARWLKDLKPYLGKPGHGQSEIMARLIAHVEELEPELEKARELVREASTAITTGAGEYGLLERMATFLEGSK